MAASKVSIDTILKTAAAWHNSGRLAEAEKGYRQILESNPDQPDALHLLGVLLGQNSNPQLGIDLVSKAIALRPKFPDALANLGLLFQNSGQTYNAVLAYTRAARLNPKNVKAWNNLSVCLSDLGQVDDALLAIHEGIEANPKHEVLYDNGCRFFKRDSNFEDCIDIADQGLKHLPDSSRLWIHRADACFALGRLEEAWKAYEWRKRAPENPNTDPVYPIPVWQGEDLTGKSILIWTEQGPGETFLFSGLLNKTIASASKCLIATTERLRPILARSFPDATVVDGTTLDVTAQTADLQSSLVDLGRWMLKRWEDFPNSTGHIQPDPTRVTGLQKSHHGEEKKPLRVGIAWRSLNVNTAAEKSIPLDIWRVILTVPGVKFVCLQYGNVQQELDQLRDATGINIESESQIDPIEDLEGHLAQIATLDLVISTSNTTAHAAGALGIPTWVLVSHTIGEGLYWPWFTERPDSPWYDSVTLYRQHSRGDWVTPIAKVAADLVILSAECGTNFDSPKHLAAIAFAYSKSGQTGPAGIVADAAIKSGFNSTDAYRVAVKADRIRGNTIVALETLNQGIKKDNNSVPLLIDRAAILRDLEKLTEAIDDLEKALEINPEQIEVLNNLARLYRANGQVQRGLDTLIKANELAPNTAGIRMSLGTFLSELGRTDESRAMFSGLINEQKDVADAGCSLAMALLLDGQFAEGWPLLRYRLARSNASIVYDHFPFPIWEGEDVKNKHVLVWTEQGIGEELLIATMIGDLQKTAKSVTLLVSKRMVAVLKRSLKGVRVAERKQPLPAEALDPRIDVQMSLGDLGQLLRPSYDSFKDSSTKPVIKPNGQIRSKLRQRYLEVVPDKPLIGLSWNSVTPEIGPLKSIDPSNLTPLTSTSDATFVCLQYSPQTEHISTLSSAIGDRWICDETVDPMTDMERATAQVAAMDFVITISNTTAHVAGALGIPTALLVPKRTGRLWYWFRKQPKALWYPSVTLYEPNDNGRWDSAMKLITEQVRSLKHTA